MLMLTGRVRRAAAAATVPAAVLAGCASPPVEQPDGNGPPPSQQPPSQQLPPPAEPGQAPPRDGEPDVGDLVQLPGGSPEGAVVEPRSGLLAVALREPDRIALVDAQGGGVNTAPVPGAARHLVAGSGGEVALLGENTDSFARVALPGGQVTEQIRTGRQPHDAAQDGGTWFVTNEFDGSVGVLRGGRMVDEIGGFTQPGGVAASGGRVATVDVRSNDLHVHDARTFALLAQLPAGAGPSHVREVGENLVAVADTRGGAVRTFDLSGRPREVDVRELPGRAYGLAGDPQRGRVVVTLADTNQVAVVDVGPDGRMGQPRLLPAVAQPNDVAVDPRDGTGYVVGTAEAQVQVLEPEVLDG